MSDNKQNNPDSFPIPIYRNELAELKAMIADMASKSPSAVTSSSPITTEQVMSTLIEIESKSIEIAKSSLSHLVDSQNYTDLLLTQAETIAKHIKRRIGLPEVS
jgi:hypothetical protein